MKRNMKNSHGSRRPVPAIASAGRSAALRSKQRPQEPAPSRHDFDEEPLQRPADEHEVAENNGPDDALGLYLRQMGAIPLLNRDQELKLARQLETARMRYRRSVLASWL